MKYVSRILKWSCYAVILSVFVLLIGRIIMSNYYPNAMTSFRPSDAFVAASSEEHVPTVYRQGLRISYDDHDGGKYARFMANHQYYCPETGELQITVRYNSSTLERVQEDFKLSAIPENKPLDLFAFSVSDNYGTTSPMLEVEVDQKFMYTYLKLTFTGIDFEVSDWLRVDIYYKGEEINGAKPYGSIVVYERELVQYSTVHEIAYSEVRRNG